MIYLRPSCGRIIWLLPLPHSPASKLSLFFSVFVCSRSTDGIGGAEEGVGEESNHATHKKACYSINHSIYSLDAIVHERWAGLFHLIKYTKILWVPAAFENEGFVKVYPLRQNYSTEANFIVPDWGYSWLRYRSCRTVAEFEFNDPWLRVPPWLRHRVVVPARQPCSLACRYMTNWQPYAEVDFIPPSGIYELGYGLPAYPPCEGL